MKRVLSVDFYKITKEKWFFIAILGMLLVSSGFMWIQNPDIAGEEFSFRRRSFWFYVDSKSPTIVN